MKATVNRTEFLKSLELAESLLRWKRTANPMFLTVNLRTVKNQLTVSSQNFDDVYFQSFLDSAETVDGSCDIEPKVLIKTIKYLSGKEITIERHNSKIVFSSDRSKGEWYGALDGRAKKEEMLLTSSFFVESKQAKKALESAYRAMDTDHAGPDRGMHRVKLAAIDGFACFLASDGNIATIAKTKTESSWRDFFIPLAAVELAKRMGGGCWEFRRYEDDTCMLKAGNSSVVWTNGKENIFPNIEGLMVDRNGPKVAVARSTLERACRLADLDNISRLEFHIKKAKVGHDLVLGVRVADAVRLEEHCPAAVQNGPDKEWLKIFSGCLILSAIKGVDSDLVLLEFSGEGQFDSMIVETEDKRVVIAGMRS